MFLFRFSYSIMFEPLSQNFCGFLSMPVSVWLDMIMYWSIFNIYLVMQQFKCDMQAERRNEKANSDLALTVHSSIIGCNALILQMR